MRVSAVIGANFGDEGKGLATDYLASQNDPHKSIVVRFNGGSQAGHTVETPDGYRHIFSHFGAGTFLQVPTFLSRYFIVNPFTFRREHERLLALGSIPKVYVDEECFVTTPYDMVINKAAETARGNGKHGSVGLGINETVTRNLNGDSWEYNVGSLNGTSKEALVNALDIMLKTYFRKRLDILTNGLYDSPVESLRDMLGEELSYEKFFEDLKYFYDNVTIVKNGKLPLRDKYEHVIFEGAQGLLLDEDHHYFPHVTRSHTGMKNVMKLYNEFELNDVIDAHYVSRTHMTRHGAGPFRTENKFMRFADETNVTNPWQGTIRYGDLDLDLWRESVTYDYEVARRMKNGHMINRIPFLTWFNYNEICKTRFLGRIDDTPHDDIPIVMAEFMNSSHFYIADGKTRKNVEKCLYEPFGM